MGKLQLSEEEKKRRSENMRRLHAEGKAGGQFGKLGGRPRKPRASEVIAEKVAEEAEQLWLHLKGLAFNSESEKIQMDTSFKLLDIEERERKATVEEEVRYEHLKQGELAELVIGNLFELIRSGQVDLGEIIDVEGAEVRPAIGPGESNGRSQEEAAEERSSD